MRSSYLFVAGTVLLSVYGQLIIKWQAYRAGRLPSGTSERLRYFGDFLLNPWVISSFSAAFIGGICWIAALSNMELSRAYPFVSASFVLVLVLSAVFFDVSLTAFKVAGASLIVVGLHVGSQA